MTGLGTLEIGVDQKKSKEILIYYGFKPTPIFPKPL